MTLLKWKPYIYIKRGQLGDKQLQTMKADPLSLGLQYLPLETVEKVPDIWATVIVW